MITKLKIVVIGAGHLGAIHIKLIAQNPNISFVGIYDVDSKKSSEQAKLYNVVCFAELDEAIEAADALLIVVPTIAHCSVAKKALLAGKHIFIEKPVCSTVAEAKELALMERDNPHLKIQVGHIERFNPAIIAAKKYNLQPKFIEAHRLTQFRPRAIDVSVIHDLMIHDIDLALWLVGSKIEQIDANGVSIITPKQDLANVRIKFANKSVANLTSSRVSANSMRKFRIFQKYCYMSLDLVSGGVEVFQLTDKDKNIDNNNANPAIMLGDINGFEDKQIVYEKPEIQTINAMATEQQAFIDSINNNTTTCCTLTEGLAALEVAEEITNII